MLAIPIFISSPYRHIADSVNQETTVSRSNREASEKRLNNLLGDINRSFDLTTEPHRHIDRLFLQCREAIEIFESLDPDTQKKYTNGGIEPVKDLYQRLGNMSVKVKNAMTSPFDFHIATNMYHGFGESVLLKLIEMNKVESKQNQEEYKRFVNKVLWHIDDGNSVEEAVEMEKDRNNQRYFERYGRKT